VDAVKLLSVLRSKPLIYDIAVEYAAQFHKRVITAFPPFAERPSDVKVPFTEYPDIVSSMDPELRTLIGHMALRYAQATSTKKLVDEVSSGIATVVEETNGEPLRIVRVTALRIERADGCVLVELGKVRDGVAKTSGKLPGSKMTGDEGPADAARRVLESQLPAVAECVEFTFTECNISIERSKQYGVRTRYLRTVQHARLIEPDARLVDTLEAIGSERASVYTAKLWATESEVCPHDLLAVGLGSDGRLESNDSGLEILGWMSPSDQERLAGPHGEQLMSQWLLDTVPRLEKATRSELDSALKASVLHVDSLPSPDELVGSDDRFRPMPAIWC